METHFGPFRTTDPVALSFLERVGPVEFIETVEQTLGIGRDAETPLVHEFLFNRVASTDRHTLADLVVGENCSEFRTPVDHSVAQIGNTIVHQGVAFLFFIHFGPLSGGEIQLLRAYGVHTFRAVFFEMSHEVGHRHCLVGGFIIVVVEHFHERPLSPFVEFRVAGFDFS